VLPTPLPLRLSGSSTTQAHPRISLKERGNEPIQITPEMAITR